MKISTCGLLGRIEEAQEHIARLISLERGSTISWIRKFLSAPLRRNPRALETFIKGAREAGLPED